MSETQNKQSGSESEVKAQPEPVERGVMPDCNYECDKDKIECRATSDDGWLCCREDDHEGNHIACNTQHAVAIWGQA